MEENINQILLNLENHVITRREALHGIKSMLEECTGARLQKIIAMESIICNDADLGSGIRRYLNKW